MTNLERLIAEQVPASVVGTVSRTIDKIAEEMAAEILKDAVFRAQIHALIKAAFRDTLTHLGEDERGVTDAIDAE